MPIRNASAEWVGSVKEGQGIVRLGSGAFEGKYNFSSRFEEGVGTNPEELIGAAHAGCFSMAFSSGLGKAGYEPVEIRTDAKVHIELEDAGFRITKIELYTVADVPGIEQDVFQEIAQDAKNNCPVSVALAVPEIVLDARLS